MSRDLEAMADAVLYEGYLLYPYRASSLKNRQRWPLGVLHPRGFCESANEGDAWLMQSEVLVSGAASLDVKVRFLHLGARAGAGAWDWQEGMPRAVEINGVSLRELAESGQPQSLPFSFDAIDEETGGVRRRWEPIEGTIELSAERVLGPGEDVFRVRARIENHTPFEPEPAGIPLAAEPDRAAARETALRRAFASAHTLFNASGGEFISLLDPPAALREAVAACRNIGTWPVLAGSRSGAAMLSSPIILYDYPQIAPESPGDLFDGAEIDEILTLRILTLSDDEKREAMATDPRARAILERTEKLDRAALDRLHGAVRYLQAPGTARTPGGATLQAGSRVRLAPRAGGDIFDIALAGRAATVASIEQDFEGQIHVAVTVDDDPGRDLGAQGMPGHRFFFRPEEVEPL